VPAVAGLPLIPPEVQQFAEEVGAAPYLPGVLAFVRRIVPPEHPVRLVAECDAEDPTDRYILFDIPAEDMLAEEMFAICERWSGELPAHCPLSHTIFFRFIIL
jgi:hypothetical protein